MINPDARFAEKPFSNRQDHRYIYWSRSHVLAIGVLNQALEAGGGLTVLYGPPGTGKSLLARRFAAEVLANRPVRYMRYPFVDELGWWVERAANPPATRGPDTLLSLKRTPTSETPPLFLIDQADHVAKTDTARLLDLAWDGKASVVLIRRERRQGRLLDDRRIRHCELEPLGLIETTDYIAHRLGVAGAEETLFSPPAVRRVHARSFGIPRNVNALCNLCLFNFPEASEISGEMVETIVRTARQRSVFPRFLRENGTKARRGRRSRIVGTITVDAAALPDMAADAVQDEGRARLSRGRVIAALSGLGSKMAGWRPDVRRWARGGADLLWLVLDGGRRTNIGLATAAVCMTASIAAVSPYLDGLSGAAESTLTALRATPAAAATGGDRQLAALLGPLAGGRELGGARSDPEETAAEEPQISLARTAVPDASPVAVPAEDPVTDPDLTQTSELAIPVDRVAEMPVAEVEAQASADTVRPVAAQPTAAPDEPRATMVQADAISLIARTLRDFSGFEDAALSAEQPVRIDAPRKEAALDASKRKLEAPPAERSARTRLVIHHSASDGRRAKALVKPLRKRGFSPELRTVPHSISRDHVRYFSKRDLARARQVVGVLAGYDTSADLRDFSGHAIDLDYGLLEVWLSN